MEYLVAAETDIGLTKKSNQDSYCVRIYQSLQGKIVFAILCDGMGGLAKGEVASASVIHGFLKWADLRLPVLTSAFIDPEVIRRDWTKLAVQYNEKIKYYGATHGVSLGTTLTAMLLTESNYYIINVGDTRAYEICDQVCVLTRDHSLVAREIQLGNLTEEEAKVDPRRSVLLQCIGASNQVAPDMFFGQTKKNAVYLLCSDGFRHEISPIEIYQTLCPSRLQSSEKISDTLRALIELNKARRERDNITAIAVKTC